MSFEFIKASETPGVCRIVLSRTPLNILDVPMMEEINQVLSALALRSDIKALVIAAEGSAFSAGVSIQDHLGDRASLMVEVFHRIFRHLHSLPCATVAAVRGAALGGGAELATFCDIVIASDKAKIGQPEIKLGVFPPVAAIHYPNRIGRAKALQLLMTGGLLSATEAQQIGLVDRVVGVDELDKAVEDVVATLTDKSGAVLALTRRAVLGSKEEFERKLGEMEQIYLQELMSCDDAAEGLRAFVEKRQPVWTNR